MNHNSETSGNDTVKGGYPLQKSNTPLTPKHARLVWLHYYNNYLLEHNAITPAEHRKMRRMIGEI